MTTLEQRGLQRRRYRQRQLLRGEDLRREIHDVTELQWWHNRALHDAYGVVRGLQVKLASARDRSWATVSPGIAYDGYGRPLVVDRALAIDLPAERVGAVLVLRSRDTGDGLGDVAACGPERPTTELCWGRTGRLSPREGVPLACLSVAGLAALPADERAALPVRLAHDGATGEIQALGRLSRADRDGALAISTDATYQAAVLDVYEASQACPWPHRARPLARPPMSSGTTQPGNTQWGAWAIPYPQPRDDDRDVLIGFEVRVDTTAAGFTTIPQYFAWLQGPLFDPQDTANSGGVHWDHIDARAVDGFTFRSSVIVRSTLARGRTRRVSGRDPTLPAWSETLRMLRVGGFYVSWLGIEPREAGRTVRRGLDEVRDGHR